MSSTDAPSLRQAMQLRAAGDLPAAVAALHARAAEDPQAGHLLLRYLFELQDYEALQQATQAALHRLTPARAAQSGTAVLVTLLHFAERCCLPAAEIAAGLAASQAAAEADPALMFAWRAVRQRQDWREALPRRFAGGAALLSLGLNCLPWTLPARWGLREMADFAPLFGPFSLAGHSIPGVITALEGGFEAFCAPEAVRVVKTQRGHELAMRVDRSANWNHNRGPYWLGQDLVPLRAGLAAKGARFAAACRRPDAVFLLAGCQVEYPEEPLDFLPRLDAALARYTGRDGNRIIITNQTARRRPAGTREVDASTSFLYCPYPTPDYVWHDDDYADSEAGLAFEHGYVEALMHALARWGLVRGAEAG
ncbi:hypothetical protein ACVFYP_06680 [Roseomonas sp. F4]